MAGIERMNAYLGCAYVDLQKLAVHRNLDRSRFTSLLMNQKTVALPYEDPVTLGVNAAKPLLDAMRPEERDRIEMVVSCTESAFDFGKALSTYFHDLLKLRRNCRLLEVKSACYSGVAGLQLAAHYVLSQASPGAKVLVIASDLSRFVPAEGGDSPGAEWKYFEPSAGAGAVAMIVSDQPQVFQLDVGASGYYGYEVMDTCRPVADNEAGDVDLSLLSYLDCFENAFRHYQERVPESDFVETFSYLSMHTPFGGMVKGAHRDLMRRVCKARPAQIEPDFERRLMPGILHCQRVGNIMGATMLLSLASTIEHGDFSVARRIGCFSYGSGCSSEFFSGVASQESQTRIRAMQLGRQLDRRHELSMDEYERVLQNNHLVKFGTRDVELDAGLLPQARHAHGAGTLFLTGIEGFHRRYAWTPLS
jgi:polyketide biosynthesis 3-hydroxy-3-methylglutaryl-CoA synthase-like enzyme PksG